MEVVGWERGRWRGDAKCGHLKRFGLLILNHRSQCPHKRCFLGKSFIFLLFLLFLIFRLFLKIILLC